jgi:hypothetical protein
MQVFFGLVNTLKRSTCSGTIFIFFFSFYRVFISFFSSSQFELYPYVCIYFATSLFEISFSFLCEISVVPNRIKIIWSSTARKS